MDNEAVLEGLLFVVGEDGLTLNMAYKIEEILGYKGQVAKGDE